MRLGVKFYKDMPKKPLGMPGNWPAHVLEIPDHEEVPDGYMEMTVGEYNHYRNWNMHHYVHYEDTYTNGKGQALGGVKGLWLKLRHYLGYPA